MNAGPLARLRARAPVLILLWCAGVYLRITILVAAPLAPTIARDLGLNQTGLGALTILPVLMLALGALPGSLLISRLGAHRTLAVALLLAAAGSAARGLAPPILLIFLATAIMGFGIAAMQPALTGLVGRWCPGYIALGTAVYLNGGLMGEFLGAGLALPAIMPLTGESWRLTLVVYTLPALAIAAILIHRRPARASHTAPAWQPNWRDRRVWKMGLLLGANASAFYGTNAYMGSILQARGQGDLLAPMLSVFNITQVCCSLLMLVLARRLSLRRAPILGSTLAVTAGLAMFMTLGTVAGFAGALMLGFASAMELILLVSLPPLLENAADAGRMAAGMFAIGYCLAFLVPLLGGAVADALHQPAAALIPMLVLGILALPAALDRRLVTPHGLQ